MAASYLNRNNQFYGKVVMTSDSSATASPCIGATRQKKRRSILALNTSFNVSIIGDMEGPESVAQAVMTPVSIHTEGGAKVLSTGNGLDQPSNKTSRRSLRADDLLSGKHTPSKDQVINRPNMNDEQLLDHYDTCIQLVNKGKVSAKNAFSLHLIDVMSDVLSSCNKDTFFQMAGCTLDAGERPPNSIELV